MRVTMRPLKLKHIMPMSQRAHAAAFSKKRNMAGWEREGILPNFTSRENWRLKF
jgi:hypothetical protein